MSINFCSYFDKNYLSKFLVLRNSIEIFNIEFKFFVLALDNYVEDFFKKNQIKNVQVISLKDLEQSYKDLIIAKNNRDLIEYYFTLSPFLPRYIFEKYKCLNISYVDSDFFFYKNPIKLFQKILNSSVTVIKQESEPQYGLFNMGLICFNFNFSETLEILNTWGEQCIDSCSDIPNLKENIYADQKYLDEWLIKLRNIKILYPEYSVLSPWDTNAKIEYNIDNFFAFHFHNFKIQNNFFYTGFCNYNKRPSKIILDKIYIPYAKKIYHVNKEYNLKTQSIRNVSNSNIKKLRNLKMFIKKIFYHDKYKLNSNNSL
jgi:hypothetical protein